MSQKWIARAPLTCGELLQGTLDGTPVLISAPINRFSEVELEEGEGVRCPSHAIKLQRALRAAGAADIHVSLHHGARCGAGYATSTADVAGGLAAWGAWRGLPFTPEELAHHSVRIEPSDSTMLPGLTLLAQQDASIIEPIGPVPRLPLLLLDPGGTLDTVHWSWQLGHVDLDETTEQALNDLRYGLLTGDLGAIGRAASRSATAYQRLLPSLVVGTALALAPAVRALGVIRAHSGPIAGLLFADEAAAWAARPVVDAALPDCAVELVTLVDGGISLQAVRPAGAF